MLKLLAYYRSSASYRVRIALNYKGLSYDYDPIHLLRNGGEQFSQTYSALNPQKLIPALLDDEQVITQSLAIMEYLEEKYPSPSLLPKESLDRAEVRALALTIACDIHPLNNLRVLKYLTETLGVTEQQKLAWIQHWIHTGFTALEEILAKSNNTGLCCYKDTPTLADMCLIPQIYNAERFALTMDQYPTLLRINEYCLSLPCFVNAHPSRQPDSE